MESMVTIELPTETISLPIVYRERDKYSYSSESTYETMAISSVVEHDGKLYRLRFPGAQYQIDNSIKVSVNGASERKINDGFDHEIGSILNYKRMQLKKSNENQVPSDVLNPIQNSTETSSTDLFSVIDGGLQGMGDITLDCFALELGGSSHYLIYIAGQWWNITRGVILLNMS